MSNPSEPASHADLSGLVRAELSTAEVLDAGDHLRRCEPCRVELAEVAVGNAVLARAGRLRARTSSPALPPALDLPPLQPVRSRTAGRTRLLAAAAAVALVATVGGVVALRPGGDDAPAPTARISALEPVGGGDLGGRALFEPADGSGDGTGSTTITIDATGMPDAGPGSFYEAWLLDPETNKMLPLGPLSGASSRFEVDDDLVAAYTAVDVSLEDDDGDPTHSATSIMRGTY